RNNRNITTLLTCIRCGTPFHPLKGHESDARYCSRACSAAYGRERMAAARAAGVDPAHGGAVAERRRRALDRRRAAGELLGMQLRKARRDAAESEAADLLPRIVAPDVVPPLTLDVGGAEVAPTPPATRSTPPVARPSPLTAEQVV